MKRTDFIYNLPADRIAKEPVKPRHSSKLLQYQGGKITHYSFIELSTLLPKNTQLVMNNAKVIPARILCRKSTGASIEIFLLEPILDYETTFSSTQHCKWKALIGNKKRWKEGMISDASNQIVVQWSNREANEVELSWESGYSFSEIINQIGQIPIPPYLNRSSTAKDSTDYQTVYAKIAGSVAAPTAGLHFTPEVIKLLSQKGIEQDETTLHVGAGTFKPVETEDITQHAMHTEHFEVRLAQIEALLEHSGPRVAIGTTSLRVLESLYVVGQKIKNGTPDPFNILQTDVFDDNLSYNDCLQAIKAYLKLNGDQLGSTQIFIYPGKKIHSINGIITNFHQPSSSLIMLIASCIGKDWKAIYQSAIENNYRFLSYGDSSLLWVR